MSWTGAVPGDHTIIVNATDDSDLTATSQVSIHVAATYPAPAWVQQPQGQAIAAGSGVLFAAQAQSSGPLSYQWYFNGQPIADGSHRLFFLNAVNPDSAGSYWVTANNGSACVTSQVAVLSVVETNVNGGEPLGFERLSIAGFDELGATVLSLQADPSTAFTLQATSSNLTNWLSLVDLTNSGNLFYFTDPTPAATNSDARFYRTVRGP